MVAMNMTESLVFSALLNQAIESGKLKLTTVSGTNPPIFQLQADVAGGTLVTISAANPQEIHAILTRMRQESDAMNEPEVDEPAPVFEGNVVPFAKRP
jgi:hypothetical protein